MLNYPFYFEKRRGIFLERKNRFIITAYLDDKIVNCHLPNSGRLWGLLIPNETELMLVERETLKKIPFAVLACKKGDNWVLLHTRLTNKIVKNLINNDRISFYSGYEVIAEEIKIENSRFDLLLSSGLKKIYLEVKTCTLFGSHLAMFPDAITARGKKHLIVLKNLANKGVMTSVLFVVMNPNVEFFLPAYHIDYEFSKTFMDVKDIVDIRAIALCWDNNLSYVESVKQLNIPFSFLEKALKDRGVYILVSHLNRSELIKIGKLGKMQFPSGYYIYVGKASNGLFKRIRRHKGHLKKIHWHIDYFLNEARVIKDFPIITDENMECKIADSLSKISDSIIPEFGSSDCHCHSHLFYFKENPTVKKEFIEIINYYRLDFIRI